MKRLLLIAALVLLAPLSAHAAIARDNAMNPVHGVSAVTTNTAAFTNTAGNFLVVPVWETGGNNFLTGVTYGGVAMTLAAKITTTSGADSLWYLVNPLTGSNNVVATFSSADDSRMGAVSYTGVAGGFDAVTTNTNTTASPFTTTLTTIADNTWAVLLGQGANAITAGTGSTFLGNDSGIDNRFTSYYDSNAALTPAGSHSMSLTHSGTATTYSVMLSFSPTAAVTASFGNFFLFQ